ncbi:MAG: hypothetical protein C4327_09045 [Meiothermus sp.]
MGHSFGHATGAPISTHTEKGSWALEQAELFIDPSSKEKHLPDRTRVKPLLEEAGLSQEQIEDILVYNPRRFLQMRDG